MPWVCLAAVGAGLWLYRWCDVYNRAVAAYVDGLAHHRSRRYAEALACYREASSLRPDYVEVYCKIGKVCSALGRHAEAEEALRRGLRADPSRAEVHLGLGEHWLDRGRVADALEPLARAVRLRPRWPRGHHVLGIAYLRAGDRDRAVGEAAALDRLDEELAKDLRERIGP